MIGTTISHYKIIEKIGSGGMGVVYKAEDTKLNRIVALKFLPPALSTDDDAKTRFINEAQAASALDHQNICHVNAIDETADGQLFIDMTYYEGQPLGSLIKNRSLSVDQTISIASQIAEGLAKAHARGIVHRDIKPANIIVTPEEKVCILDFGLAKLIGGTRLTQDGTTVGTIAYMSPEQTRSEQIDHRTDIWSLGVIIYEMISGKLPFRGEYEQAIIYSILNDEPDFSSDVEKSVPEELIPIISKTLTKEPSQRYQQVDELIADLRVLTGESDTGSFHVRRKKSLRKRIKSIPGLLLIILIIFAGYLLFAPEAESMERVPIVVIDFLNETGEKELDALSGVLITSLEQSRRLSVFTRSSMFDILKKLGKSDVEHIDESLGREICQHAGIQTMAQASIRKFGQLYSIDLKVLSTEQDEYLFAAKEDGEGQESIPGMIDDLAEKTREGLEEAKNDIAASQRSVENLTTSNLQTYYHYYKGKELGDKLKFWLAAQELKQAIQIDSTFALAYYALAYVKWWLPGTEEKFRIDLLDKALSFPDRLPEKEKILALGQIKSSKDGFESGFYMLKPFEKIYPDDKEILFNIGDYAFHAQMDSVAGLYLDKVIEKDPVHIRALDHRIQLYNNEGKYHQAYEMFNKVFPETLSSELFYAKGYTAMALDRYEDAEKIFKKCLAIDPDDHHIQYALGKSIFYQKRYAEAESIFTQLIEKSNDDLPRTLGSLLGWSLYHQEKYRDSEKIFKRYIELFPEYATPYLGLEFSFLAQNKLKEVSKLRKQSRAVLSQHTNSLSANAWSEHTLRNYKLAESMFRKHLEFEPNNKMSLNGLGWSVYYQRQNYNMAQTYFKKAIKIDPGFIFPLRGFGFTLYRQQKYDSAQVIFERLVQLENNSEFALRYLSTMLSRQNKYSEAQKVLEKVIELYPNAHRNYRQLLWSYMFQAKYEELKVALNTYLKRNPEFSYKDEFWGNYYLGTGDFKKAEKHYLHAFASDSNSIGTNKGLSALYTHKNKFKEAEEYERKALERTPLGFKDYTYLAWIYVKGYQDYDNGIALGQATIDSCRYLPDRLYYAKLNPYMPIAEHSIGIAYLKKGEYKEAVEYLEKAVELLPEQEKIKMDLLLARAKLDN